MVLPDGRFRIAQERTHEGVIHHCRQRLINIAAEMHTLSATSLFGLTTMAEDAAAVERDLISEMAGRLDRDIAQAKEEVADFATRARCCG